MPVALVLPPLTQVNTPYPGPAYLARCLRDHGIESTQWDLGLELVLAVFSRAGLDRVFDAVAQLAEGEPLPGANPECADGLPEPAWQALALRQRHLSVVEPVIRFLQGHDRTLARRLLQPGFLPPGPRLDAAPRSLDERAVDDAARLRASLYIEDLADLVASTVDPGFGLARYQHHLGLAAHDFGPLQQRLDQTTVIDAIFDALIDHHLADRPDLLCLSVPFPGTLYGALRIGRRAKAQGLPVLMGGGYVTTELRRTQEPRLWQYIDGLSFDDGEGPLLAWLEWQGGGPDRRHRTRTAAGDHDAQMARPPTVSAAWYGDLDLSRYLQIVDTLNPAHRLWGDGRWNKLTLAHGCYWKRCAFCDIQLDYIGRYEPHRVDALLDAIEELIEETGQRGFHIVDEAAPPRLMRDLALGLLARGIDITWWGNIRFERAFTPDLCRLLAASGLVMVTGGLEVASDRVLAAMDKGITVEQAARAAHHFRQAGVAVHAYLMYGFPGQTIVETVDSMEIVRQLFAAGALDSGFWHRFVLTRHSGVGADPAAYGVAVQPVPADAFADNDLDHIDDSGADPEPFDQPLVASLAAWMAGEDLDGPVNDWLPDGMPLPTEPADRIERALAQAPPEPGDRLVWLGGELLQGEAGLVLFGRQGPVEVSGRDDALEWLAEVIEAARPGQPALSAREALAVFPGGAKLRRRLLAAAGRAGLLRL